VSTNPYESPRSDATDSLPLPAERAVAKRNVRIALLIMLAPAIYNFICFNFPTNPNRIQLPIFHQAVNGIGFVTIVIAIWCQGLAMLEFLTGGFHAVFSRNSKLADWKSILYSILRRAPAFAFFGALLWSVWVAAFYQLDIGFYTVSVPIGIAAHLLAAGLYVPLFYRWYKMERASPPQMTT
jgi:hypothetical protein